MGKLREDGKQPGLKEKEIMSQVSEMATIDLK